MQALFFFKLCVLSSTYRWENRNLEVSTELLSDTLKGRKKDRFRIQDFRYLSGWSEQVHPASRAEPLINRISGF